MANISRNTGVNALANCEYRCFIDNLLWEVEVWLGSKALFAHLLLLLLILYHYSLNICLRQSTHDEVGLKAGEGLGTKKLLSIKRGSEAGCESHHVKWIVDGGAMIEITH